MERFNPARAVLRACVPTLPRVLAVCPTDVEQFLSEMSTFIALKQDLKTSLHLLVDRQHLGPFRRILQQISDAVDKGMTLGQEMERFPACFTPITTAMIRCGETQECLALALHHSLVHQAKKRATLQRQQRHVRALLGAGGLIAALLLVTVMMLTEVIAPLYRELGMQIPPAMVALLGASRMVRDGGWLIATLFGLAGIIGWVVWSSRRPGTSIQQRFFNLPGVGSYLHQMLVSRMAFDVGTLLQCGMDNGKAYTLAVEQHTSLYSIGRLSAKTRPIPDLASQSMISELGTILSSAEQGYLGACDNREDLGQTLKDIAATHAYAAHRMETWAVRSLLGILFLVLVLFMVEFSQVFRLADLAHGGW